MAVACKGTEDATPGYLSKVVKIAEVSTSTNTWTCVHEPGLVQETEPPVEQVQKLVAVAVTFLTSGAALVAVVCMVA